MKYHNGLSIIKFNLIRLSDKYASELKKYNLICYFCECYDDESTVNLLCPKNSSEYNNTKEGKNKLNYKKVDPDFVNTRRHYFVKPIDEGGLRENFNESEFNKTSLLEHFSELEEAKGK